MDQSGLPAAWKEAPRSRIAQSAESLSENPGTMRPITARPHEAFSLHNPKDIVYS